MGMGVKVFVFGQFEKLDGETQPASWMGFGMLISLACTAAAVIGDTLSGPTVSTCSSSMKVMGS